MNNRISVGVARWLVWAIILCVSPAGYSREWSDASGKFRVEGKLVGVVDGQVELKLSDGRQIKVPLARLSKKDQQFIADEQQPTDSANAVRAAKLVEEAFVLLRFDARKNATVIDAKLREASRLHPTNINAEFLRGIYHLLVSNNAEKSATSFENCLKRQPDNAAVLCNLGVSRFKAGDFTRAFNHWKRASEVAVGLPAITQNLARALHVYHDERVLMPQRTADQIADLYATLVAGEKFPAGEVELGWALVTLDPDKADSDDQALPADITGGGTGFVVLGDFLVTNRHVVENATAVQIRVPDKDLLLPAKVIARSDSADLAIVHCPGLSLPAVSLVAQIPRRGSDVMVLGFPQFSQLGASIKSTRGAVTSLPAKETEAMLLIDAEMNSGNSGGPIANKYGQVVAVATAVFKPQGGTGGRYGAGIPLASQLEFLQKHIPKLSAAPASDKEVDWPDVDEAVSRSTVLVLVGGAPRGEEELFANVIYDPTCPACGGKGVLKTARDSGICPHCRGLGLDSLAVVAVIARKRAAGPVVKPAGEIPADRWTEVLSWADPATGQPAAWTRDKTNLVTCAGNSGKSLELPLSVEGSYQLELTATVDKGPLLIVIPVGKRQVNLSVARSEWMLQWLDGQNRSFPVEQPNYEYGQPVELLITVNVDGENAEILAAAAGRQFAQWKGKVASLEGWKGNPSRPILAGWENTIIFHSASFRLVNGKATRH